MALLATRGCGTGQQVYSYIYLIQDRLLCMETRSMNIELIPLRMIGYFTRLGCGTGQQVYIAIFTKYKTGFSAWKLHLCMNIELIPLRMIGYLL